MLVTKKDQMFFYDNDSLQGVNSIGNFQMEDAMHDWTSARCRFNQTAIQSVCDIESTFIN